MMVIGRLNPRSQRLKPFRRGFSRYIALIPAILRPFGQRFADSARIALRPACLCGLNRSCRSKMIIKPIATARLARITTAAIADPVLAAKWIARGFLAGPRPVPGDVNLTQWKC
jgi:hypothetical protein